LTKFFPEFFKSIFDFKSIKVEFYEKDYAGYIRIRGKWLLKGGYQAGGCIIY
jgi:hypothetical protein